MWDFNELEFEKWDLTKLDFFEIGIGKKENTYIPIFFKYNI